MDENHIVALLPDYLDDALGQEERAQLEGHLATCAACAKELEEMKVLFEAFGQEKGATPPERIKTNFYKLLELEKQADAKVIPLNTPATEKRNWTKDLLRVAASIVLLLGAFLFGQQQQQTQSNKEIALLQDERQEIKETAMLSLMENKSASKRIQGVNYIEEFTDPDEAIVLALIDRMRYDANTNVRLTAVDALGRFTASENVKNAFIAALKTEKDPSIQITIIQVLVKIQEKKAVKPMQELLEREDTQPFIKEQIKTLLPSIV
ncbi:HEAT repeat domain-containing protein [Spongiimicrobium sp. 2-473A-2-J]|uniref:HEAT repeat domain-containing protein n=1 Tax=Eudoraea algarum TaxID=3417568 RepID=UPI003D3686D0